MSEEIAFNDGKLRVAIGTLISADTMTSNMVSALARGLREIPICKPHNEIMSIAAGGPSLSDTYGELEGHVAAANGSLGFLLDRGVVPHFCGVMDANAHMADIVAADPRIYYLVASNCHPTLLDKLLGAHCDVRMWHPTPDNIGASPDQMSATDKGFALLGQTYPNKFMIGGGCTIGLRLIMIGYVLGYRNFKLHGLDSSFRNLETHAYPDARDGEWALRSSLEINGYRTSLNFLAQVTAFSSLLESLQKPPFEPVKIEVFGDGLLQSCYRFWQDNQEEMSPSDAFQCCNIPRKLEAYERRALALLDRLPPHDVIGAEIGVFTGKMSQELLARRHDLRLLMIDSWEGEGAAYSDTKNDYHARLDGIDQERNRNAALARTQFAKDRRSVLRDRSVNAALDVEDGSLDFVFIDADHSEAGCSRDIDAWFPKLKSGGLLSGHDYAHPLFPGVRKAVDTFVKRIGMKLELGDDWTWFAVKPC